MRWCIWNCFVNWKVSYDCDHGDILSFFLHSLKTIFPTSTLLFLEIPPIYSGVWKYETPMLKPNQFPCGRTSQSLWEVNVHFELSRDKGIDLGTPLWAVFFAKWSEVKWSESHSVVSDSLWLYGLYSPWNSLGQNTEYRGIKPRSPTLQVDSLPAGPPGKPICGI